MEYKITYENGAERYCDFHRYEDAEEYAENNNGGWNYTIEEYEEEYER